MLITPTKKIEWLERYWGGVAMIILQAFKKYKIV